MLVAVTGFAIAAEAIVVPAELAAAVPELPRAAKGAMQAISVEEEREIKNQTNKLGCIAKRTLLFDANKIKDPCSPIPVNDRLKLAVRSLII